MVVPMVPFTHKLGELVPVGNGGAVVMGEVPVERVPVRGRSVLLKGGKPEDGAEIGGAVPEGMVVGAAVPSGAVPSGAVPSGAVPSGA